MHCADMDSPLLGTSPHMPTLSETAIKFRDLMKKCLTR